MSDKVSAKAVAADWESCRLILLEQKQYLADIHQIVSNLGQRLDLLNAMEQSDAVAKTAKKPAAKRSAASSASSSAASSKKPSQSLANVKFDNILRFFNNVYKVDDTYFDCLFKDKAAILEKAKATWNGKTGEQLTRAKASVLYEYISENNDVRAKLASMQDQFKVQYSTASDDELETLKQDSDSDTSDEEAAKPAAAAKRAPAKRAPPKKPVAEKKAAVVSKPADDSDSDESD